MNFIALSSYNRPGLEHILITSHARLINKFAPCILQIIIERLSMECRSVVDGIWRADSILAGLEITALQLS